MKYRIIIFVGLFVALIFLSIVFLREHSVTTNNKKSLQQSPQTQRNPTLAGDAEKRTVANETNIPPVTNLKMATELVAGGQHWQFNFADRSLSTELMHRIIYDLNLIFGHMTDFVIDTLDPPLLADNLQELDRRVRFEGGILRRPTSIKSDYVGCLFRGGSDRQIYVPRSVTDKYLEAIKLEGRNNIALGKLDEFLKQMSQLREHPIENVREIMVFEDDNKVAEGGDAKVDPAEFAEVWGGKTYRAPSILDVQETSGSPLEKYGALVAKTYTNVSNNLTELPQLVYVSGQWKFLIQRSPT